MKHICPTVRLYECANEDNDVFFFVSGAAGGRASGVSITSSELQDGRKNSAGYGLSKWAPRGRRVPSRQV